ncbi:MAG: hypothetical protein ACLTSG_00565 [Lachnospiraceae bacterium]
MKKRITAALLALCLVLPLAACGQAAEPELDIDAFGEELYAAGKFGETLYAPGRGRGPGALRHGG